MKRVCAVLLTAILLLMAPFSVFADGEEAPRYKIQADENITNGSIAFTDDMGNPVKDAPYFKRVNIVVTPAEGYELVKGDDGIAEIYAVDGQKNRYTVDESGGRYYLLMPAADVTVHAEFQVHEHNWDYHAYVAPTCEAVGNVEYWYCTSCKSYFEDAGATRKISRADIVLPAIGHEWGPWKVVKEPTGTTPGEKRRVCKNDSSHFESQVIPATGKKEVPANVPENIPEPEKKKSSVKTVLPAKVTAARDAVTISWDKIKKADRYVIMFSKCNDGVHEYTVKKIKTVKAGVSKYTVRDLEPGKCYKCKVIAQKKGKKKYKNIAQSLLIHTITGNESTGHTVPKRLKLNKSRITLKKNKTSKLKGEIVLFNRCKELLAHEPALRFTSSNKSVATVSKSGKIRAKGRGTCTIYVQTINGLCRKCKVTVK